MEGNLQSEMCSLENRIRKTIIFSPCGWSHNYVVRMNQFIYISLFYRKLVIHTIHTYTKCVYIYIYIYTTHMVADILAVELPQY